MLRPDRTGVPEGLGNLFGGRDAARSARVMKAMLKMRKLDIRRLRQAYANASDATDEAFQPQMDANTRE